MEILDEGFEDSITIMALPSKYRKTLRTNNPDWDMTQRLFDMKDYSDQFSSIQKNLASALHKIYILTKSRIYTQFWT